MSKRRTRDTALAHLLSRDGRCLRPPPRASGYRYDPRFGESETVGFPVPGSGSKSSKLAVVLRLCCAVRVVERSETPVVNAHQLPVTRAPGPASSISATGAHPPAASHLISSHLRAPRVRICSGSLEPPQNIEAGSFGSSATSSGGGKPAGSCWLASGSRTRPVGRNGRRRERLHARQGRIGQEPDLCAGWLRGGPPG